MALSVKQKDTCRWDSVSLGEVMLRFDPGDYRIWTTRHFEVSEGGGEYNVARGLKRCFGLETAIVTSFAAGLIYGFLAGQDPLWAVECGNAHGALAMTTPGDTTMATLEEVLHMMKGAGARIVR